MTDYNRGYRAGRDHEALNARIRECVQTNGALSGHLINATIVACALASFLAAGPSILVLGAILCAIGAWALAHLASDWSERYAEAYRRAYLLAFALTVLGAILALGCLTRG